MVFSMRAFCQDACGSQKKIFVRFAPSIVRSISRVYLNSLPLSVKITGKSLRKVLSPNALVNQSKCSTTELAFPSRIRKISIKLCCTNSIVSILLPFPCVPRTVSQITSLKTRSARLSKAVKHGCSAIPPRAQIPVRSCTPLLRRPKQTAWIPTHT